MTTHYTLTVPVTYENDSGKKTRFTRVGAMFENTRQGTGEIFYTIKLDFPVAVSELVAFPPKTDAEIEDNGA